MENSLEIKERLHVFSEEELKGIIKEKTKHIEEYGSNCYTVGDRIRLSDNISFIEQASFDLGYRLAKQTSSG